MGRQSILGKLYKLTKSDFVKVLIMYKGKKKAKFMIKSARDNLGNGCINLKDK